jgi:hypothetical protein
MTEGAYLEPTRLSRQWLRRFNNGLCPLKEGDLSYHEARTEIGVGPADQITGDVYPHEDSRWPTKCGCGYPFTDRDSKQLYAERIYRRSDTGEELLLKDAPVGMVRRHYHQGQFS